MPTYYRKKGTTQIVTETGEVTTDPLVMREIKDIGKLPIWEEKEKVLRYGGEDDKRKKLMEGLDITPPTAEEEEEIREKTRKAIEAQIDAIDAMYAGLARREEEKGVERLGRTRAMVSRGGLLGSPMGVAQMEKTKQYTAEQLKLLEEEKNVRIQSILGRADERAEEEIRLKQKEARENIAIYMDYLKGVRDEAREDWSGLAKSGVTLDQIKENKEYYDQALEELNMNNLKFDFWYESNLPKAQQLDYSEIEYRGDNGNLWLKRIGFDPVTGEKKEYNYDLGLPWPTEPTEIKVFDGVPYKAVKDEEGNVIKYERIPGVEEKGLERTTANIFKVMGKTGKTLLEVKAMSDEEFAKELYGVEGEGDAWEWADQLIRLNPDATYEDLEIELRSNPNAKGLSDGDIKTILERAGKEKKREGEIFLTDEALKSIAKTLVETYGKEDAVKATEFGKNFPLEIDGSTKEVDLSSDQIKRIVEIINTDYSGEEYKEGKKEEPLILYPWKKEFWQEFGRKLKADFGWIKIPKLK